MYERRGAPQPSHSVPACVQIAGYIIFTTNQLTVHISKVAVDKACRRRGVATKLVKVGWRQVPTLMRYNRCSRGEEYMHCRSV